MLKRLSLALVLCVAGLGAAAAQQAGGPEQHLDDPALERRAVELHKELRCLVCQNQSIAESNADLARDLRVLVRERLAAGDSDQEVRDFMVARYGDWVLLAPPVKRDTWLLWFGPALVLLLAAAGVVLWYRRRAGAAPPAPLSEDERRRLAHLLKAED